MSDKIYHMPLLEAIQLPTSVLVTELQNTHTTLLLMLLKMKQKAKA